MVKSSVIMPPFYLLAAIHIDKKNGKDHCSCFNVQLYSMVKKSDPQLPIFLLSALIEWYYYYMLHR